MHKTNDQIFYFQYSNMEQNNANCIKSLKYLMFWLGSNKSKTFWKKKERSFMPKDYSFIY